MARSRASWFLPSVVALGFLAGCTHLVPLVPDSKWHTVYSIQIPDKSVTLEVTASTVARPHCDRRREPRPTEIRIILVESFQDLGQLPERLEDSKPREDGVPLKVADSGPYDLTLVGSRRLLPLITGKQLVARTADNCTALRIANLTTKD